MSYIDKQALRISELEELNDLLREKVKKLESDLWDKEQLRLVYSEKSFNLDSKVRELEARNQKDFVWRGNEISRLNDEVDELKEKLEAAEKRNAKLQSENAYIRNRFKELDLLIGKNILVMQAAIIEWQSTGDAKSGLAWIYNALFGPGELPDESEKDAQAYFNRKYAPIDEKLMELHKWFWEQSEAERSAGIRIKGE
ncbi:ead/Ea22-like family protein [Salmonella enterica]|nr:ead/Ea22-like family protein [Salmonella enterica]